MTRIFRTVVFWLARVAGIVGLVAGGKSLAKYVVAWIKDPYFDSFSYNDLVFSGGVIFLLSLMVLIFADVGRVVCSERSIQGDPTSLPGKAGGSTSKALEITAAPASSPGTEAVVDRETADEKLARLLKAKK